MSFSTSTTPPTRRAKAQTGLRGGARAFCPLGRATVDAFARISRADAARAWPSRGLISAELVKLNFYFELV